MKYNTILDIRKEDTGTEPCTLAECKAHLNIDFSDDDAMLTKMIKSCRLALEAYTGVSIVSKEITALLQNGKGGIELPYGPIAEDSVTAVDSYGNEASVVLKGFNYQKLDYPRGEVTVTYETGFDSVPEDLKLAILHEIAYRYENRGEENPYTKYEMQAKSSGLSESARELASSYKRTVCLL